MKASMRSLPVNPLSIFSILSRSAGLARFIDREDELPSPTSIRVGCETEHRMPDAPMASGEPVCGGNPI